ncbi:MATE family efflux transporter [Facklamia miroungae]|uniref:Multidrug export protein MepA n=1 Tax=Facklamia miroungae TaxID=120956 RepID=A0A1G7U4B2_9LACT|nr:MATE family efflux transporter [Facklamia miroungae]NKZ29904.1 MATE family efflux transporter [Facklamia miroungae]SDG42244.1 putative efflux protein, MATE family [Facklamia miroungae]
MTQTNQSIKTLYKHNPLETEPVAKLLRQFAIPSIIANLANSLYNIVDQIFIGQGVGYLGNAATNIAFPITTVCLAIGLLTGIGAAANFNLTIGRKDYTTARNTLGTAFGFLLLSGFTLALIVFWQAGPLMAFFGATEKVYPLSVQYVQIIALGIPFFMLGIGGANLVRADGSAKYSMTSILIGAAINMVLDPLFIFVFNWGIRGAAWATIIGQIASGLFILAYLPRFKQVDLSFSEITIQLKELWQIFKLGINALVFQLSNTIVQIVLNNTLKFVGASSIYGADIPIAAAGITIKINTLFIGVVIGIVQGAQPILSVNYGAKNYLRVRETFKLEMKVLAVFSLIMFIIFQTLTRPLISIFGNGDELYFTYSVHYLRVFLFMTVITGLHIGMANFLSAIGYGFKSAFLALSKQIIFLLPLILFLGHTYGVEQVPLAAPLAHGMAFVLAIYFIYRQFKSMPSENIVTFTAK